MTFESTEEIDNWMKTHWENGCRSKATAGEHYIISFIPTGLGDVVKCKCLVCGEELTSYENL